MRRTAFRPVVALSKTSFADTWYQEERILPSSSQFKSLGSKLMRLLISEVLLLDATAYYRLGSSSGSCACEEENPNVLYYNLYLKE